LSAHSATRGWLPAMLVLTSKLAMTPNRIAEFRNMMFTIPIKYIAASVPYRIGDTEMHPLRSISATLPELRASSRTHYDA
jgi:hypothetical protein